MTCTVTPEQEGARLDVILAAAAGVSRSAAADLIAGGHVQVVGATAAKNLRLRAGDVVEYQIPAPRALETVAEDIPLSIVYEDDDLLVIDKPSGMVVHPAAGHEDGTLVNALLHHCRGSLSGINGTCRPGIVHRIDKDTSGLLAVAKNDMAHQALAAQLADHTMRRTYHALALGGFRDEAGTVALPIGRNPNDRKKMAVVREGSAGARHAVTHYRVLAQYSGITYLSLQLETGRTHQIRVHMAALGHPLLGDTVYGGGHTPFERRHAADLHGQCLHAKELTLCHPRTGESMTFTCPLPQEMQHLLAILSQGER